MTALAADYYRESLTTDPEVSVHPVNATSEIFAGGYVCREASTAMCVPGADTAGLIPLGVALEGLDNTSGADGTVTRTASARAVRVANGIFPFTVSTGTPLPGNVAYLVDDNTVRASASTNGIVAGVFVREFSSGVWYVDTRKRGVSNSSLGPGAAVAALTDDLTEDSGAIGGTNDGDLPSLTATAATLTGTLTGTANGSLVDVAATAGSCAGGAEPSATNVDTAIATAVATIVTGVNEQNKEMQAQINALIADNVALRAAVREVADFANTLRAKVDELSASLRTAGIIQT